MKVDKIAVAGAVLALIAIGLSISIVLQFSFPIFKYATSTGQLININSDIGPQSSDFMWTNRTIDLMAQAIVIFAAAMGCLAMLRISQVEDKVNA